MAQIIYLEKEDNITVARERLEWAQVKQVLLVIPHGNKEFRDPLNLRLLYRTAAELALEVAIVSKDSVIRQLAREEGFRVYSSEGLGQRGRWKGKPLKPRIPASSREDFAVPKRMSARLGEQILAATFALALIVIGIMAVVLIVPSAEVTIEPGVEAVSASMVIRANPDIEEVNEETVEIPARVVEIKVEGTEQTATTGQKDMADTRAGGTVVFINQLSEEITIPEGTVVRTSAGVNVRFNTVETVILPPNGTAEARVIAVEPGPSGNVSALTINTIEGPLAVKARVINDSATKGGAVSRTATVSNEDKERLRRLLVQRLHQEAQTTLQEELEEQEFLVPETVTVTYIIDEIYDKNPDEPAEFLNLTLRVMARGAVINRADANKLALRQLENQIPAGYELLPENLNFRIEDAMTVEGNTITFNAGATGFAVAQIDVGQIRELIRWQTIHESHEILRNRLPLAGEPEIKVSPNWLGRVPWFPFRIYVYQRLAEE